MKLTTDTRERWLIVILFTVEVYKILMGTCLTIFVPMKCNTALCSLQEIIHNDTILHRVAMGINAFSLLTMILLYSVELYRENWCIKYLDIDDTKSVLSLDTEIESYPSIKQNMNKINKKYLWVVNITTGVQILNICISSVDIALAWAGIASLTPLASYVLLLLMKLFYSYKTSKASLKEERAYSSYMRIQKSYNTIDSDYKLTNQKVV